MPGLSLPPHGLEVMSPRGSRPAVKEPLLQAGVPTIVTLTFGRLTEAAQDCDPKTGDPVCCLGQACAQQVESGLWTEGRFRD